MHRHQQQHTVLARALLLLVYTAFLITRLSFNVEQAGTISSHFFLASAEISHSPQKSLTQGKFSQPANTKSNFRLNKRFQPEKTIGIIVSNAFATDICCLPAPETSFFRYNHHLPQFFLIVHSLRGPPVVA